MFPLTHTYLSTRVVKKKTPLFVFGSIVSDLPWVSNGKISRELHDNPYGFYSLLKKNHSSMLDLGLGGILHNDQNGADYYSHHFEGGYAMVKGEKINGEVAKLLGIDEGKDSLVYAHSFIEAAVDSHVLDKNPDVLKLYTASFRSIKLPDIANCISEFLKIETKTVLEEINFFVENFKPVKIKSLEGYAYKVAPAYYLRTRGINVDKEETLRIMKKAKELTKDCFSFLDEVIRRMKKDFVDLV